jgi:Zn-dependent protease with chaperone function
VITGGLLVFAVLLAVLAPRVIEGSWSVRAPRLAVFAWQAASAGVVLATVLAGLTFLAPATAVSEGLAAVLDACAATIASVYSSPGRLPGVLTGFLLAGLVPLRLGWVAVRSGLRDGKARRRLRSSVLIGARHQPSLGALVMESDEVAAFCVPGRHNTVVLTTAAIATLSDEELAGVLAHERAHLHGRHHLAVGGARILARAFPGVPLFGRATGEIERLVELLADDAAARQVDRVEVASALVSLAGMRAPSTVLAAAQGVGALRVTRLLRPAAPIGALPRIAAVAIAVLAVGGPVMLAAWPLLTATSSGLCVLPGDGWS